MAELNYQRVRQTLGLLRSMILSGEEWTEENEREFRMALEALDRLGDLAERATKTNP